MRNHRVKSYNLLRTIDTTLLPYKTRSKNDSKKSSKSNQFLKILLHGCASYNPVEWKDTRLTFPTRYFFWKSDFIRWFWTWGCVGRQIWRFWRQNFENDWTGPGVTYNRPDNNNYQGRFETLYPCIRLRHSPRSFPTYTTTVDTHREISRSLHFHYTTTWTRQPNWDSTTDGISVFGTWTECQRTMMV